MLPANSSSTSAVESPVHTKLSDRFQAPVAKAKTMPPFVPAGALWMWAPGADGVPSRLSVIS